MNSVLQASVRKCRQVAPAPRCVRGASSRKAAQDLGGRRLRVLHADRLDPAGDIVGITLRANETPASRASFSDRRIRWATRHSRMNGGYPEERRLNGSLERCRVRETPDRATRRGAPRNSRSLGLRIPAWLPVYHARVRFGLGSRMCL